uniref:Uncharacterized protein n=1 Tax=Anguilla anguilla TaxID=7936 RepID=A0A0E9RPA3_ANGAN
MNFIVLLHHFGETLAWKLCFNSLMFQGTC